MSGALTYFRNFYSLFLVQVKLSDKHAGVRAFVSSNSLFAQNNSVLQAQFIQYVWLLRDLKHYLEPTLDDASQVSTGGVKAAIMSSATNSSGNIDSLRPVHLTDSLSCVTVETRSKLLSFLPQVSSAFIRGEIIPFRYHLLMFANLDGLTQNEWQHPFYH